MTNEEFGNYLCELGDCFAEDLSSNLFKAEQIRKVPFSEDFIRVIMIALTEKLVGALHDKREIGGAAE